MEQISPIRIEHGYKAKRNSPRFHAAEGCFCDFAWRPGACVRDGRYGETVETVTAAIETMRESIEGRGGQLRDRLCILEPRSQAERHARRNRHDHQPRCPRGAMAQAAPAIGGVLKLERGGADDLKRIEAVYLARPDARLILDADEGLEFPAISRAAAMLGVALIEPPFPAGEDAALERRQGPSRCPGGAAGRPLRRSRPRRAALAGRRCRQWLHLTQRMGGTAKRLTTADLLMQCDGWPTARPA